MAGRWKHGFLWLLCLMVLFPGVMAQAASSKSVTGTCNYDYAYQILELVNQERGKAGAKKLKMDSALLEAAMLRAAECTVKFNHTRPNGKMCFTVNKKVYAENIAWGYKTPKDVMKGWIESSGHKKNMLNKKYKSIGIGCFYKGGKWYWVQCFGNAKGDGVSNPGNSKNTYKVATAKSEETELTKTEQLNPLSSKVAGLKATAGKKKLTIAWASKGGINGYELQIADNKSYKSAETYTIDKSKRSKTITKYNSNALKAKQKYYVRIRAYTESVDEEGNVVRQYNKWNQLNAKTK